MLVIRAGNHNILVSISNREDCDRFDLGLPYLSKPFCEATSVQNFRTFTVVIYSMMLSLNTQSVFNQQIPMLKYVLVNCNILVNSQRFRHLYLLVRH